MRLPVNQALPLAALVVLGGCGASSPHPQTLPPASVSGPAADYPMVIGEPYVVDGVTYTPADRMNSDEVGYATSGSEGGSGISAAHRTLPLPSYVEVTALDSGRTILVRLERRGPASNDTLIELSPGAATQLGVAGKPRVAVRVRRVNPPEPERALLRSGQQAPVRMDTPRSLLSVLIRKLEPAASSPPVALPSPVPVVAPAARPAPASKPPQPAVGVVLPAKPQPAARPAPATRPAVAAPARPARSNGGAFVVQAGAFSAKARADTVAARIGGAVQSRRHLWVVRMGPFESRAQAEAALAKARSAGYGEARIQRAD